MNLLFKLNFNNKLQEEPNYMINVELAIWNKILEIKEEVDKTQKISLYEWIQLLI